MASCEKRDEAAVQALIAEAVEKNIALFQSKQMNRCNKEAMDIAIKLADSLLIAEALMAKDTSLLIRPLKPQKPIVKMPIDSTPIKPLFEKVESNSW